MSTMVAGDRTDTARDSLRRHQVLGAGDTVMNKSRQEGKVIYEITTPTNLKGNVMPLEPVVGGEGVYLSRESTPGEVTAALSSQA